MKYLNSFPENACPFLPVSLSDAIKTGTTDKHHQIVQHPFMKSILEETIQKEEYAQFQMDNLLKYKILESKWQQVEATFNFPSYFKNLFRKESLRDDLNNLDISSLPSEASQEYGSYLHTLAKDQPSLLVSHVYVHYMGELSGGLLLLKDRLAKKWPEAVSSYDFNRLFAAMPCQETYHTEREKALHFKELFKQAVDFSSIKLSDEGMKPFVAEARKAYDFTLKIFDSIMHSKTERANEV